MSALQPATASVAKTLALRVARNRHVTFWMREFDAAWSVDTLRARVVDIVAETHDVRTFVLAPNRRWPGHLAGQFVTVEVEVEGVLLQRCYSISSPPGDGPIAITVKRVAGGRVSTWMHERLRRGDVVTLGPPMGEFVAPAGASKLLLLSGGSGATPVMSILRDLARRGATSDVVYVHAARSKRDILFERELATLAGRHPGLRVAFRTDDDPAGAFGPAGQARLDRITLRATVPDFEDRDTMLCGPPAMMAALAPIWADAGIGHRLKTERFIREARVDAPGDLTPTKVTLSLVRSGRVIATDRSETLLEQLERAGERPESGCRMGICNTCVCRKRSGVVEDVVTGKVSSEPDEDIRLCVSRARTDVEIAL